MTLLLILGFLMVAALVLVSLINQTQRREQTRRQQQRQLRLRVEFLEEIINCLLQTLPNRHIAKHVNDEILELLHEMSRLARPPSTHIETSIRNAQVRGEELETHKERRSPSFLKESDIQIAQTQLHLNQTAQVLRSHCNRGWITAEELDGYLSDLSWAVLMVSVVSLVGQGNKAKTREDVFSTHAFYKKAQHMLIESTHPEPKRMRMIKELGEIIGGTRKALSQDLMLTNAISSGL